MIQSSTFELPLQGHFFHRASFMINGNMTPFWHHRHSYKEAFCCKAIFSLPDAIPGVTPIETPQGIKSLTIDLQKLSPQAILAAKVSNVHYKMNHDDILIGEIRLPEVPQLVQAREALLQQMPPNEVTLPLKGHLFGNQCYVAHGYGITKRTFIPFTKDAQKPDEPLPDFEIVESYISAFHTSETRLRLTEDKSRVVLLLDKLSPEEWQSRCIDNVRYTMRGTGDYSEDDERQIDGRLGHIEFEFEDLPRRSPEKG